MQWFGNDIWLLIYLLMVMGLTAEMYRKVGEIYMVVSVLLTDAIKNNVTEHVVLLLVSTRYQP